MPDLNDFSIELYLKLSNCVPKREADADDGGTELERGSSISTSSSVQTSGSNKRLTGFTRLAWQMYPKNEEALSEEAMYFVKENVHIL